MVDIGFALPPSTERDCFDALESFFSEISMTRSSSYLAVACALFLMTGCGKAEFKEFTSAAGKYKAEMPGKPKEETQNTPSPDGRQIALNVASVQQKDGVYVVMYSDLPIPAGESDAKIQERLDGSREGALKNINGKLTKETKITLADKYPGRDIEAELPGGKGSLRVKIYMVGTRLYQVMVVGTATWVASADSARFLDSFALVQ